MREWEVLFVNNPADDYALMMEFWFGDEQIAVIRRQGKSLVVDLYGTGRNAVVIPLDWLIEKLQAIQRDASEIGSFKRARICYEGQTVATAEGQPEDMAVYLCGTGRKSVVVSLDWLLQHLQTGREDLLKDVDHETV
jgi:hypothetical protein